MNQIREEVLLAGFFSFVFHHFLSFSGVLFMQKESQVGNECKLSIKLVASLGVCMV